VKAWVEAHPDFVENAQAVLLFRRPVASVALLVVVNLHFRLYAAHLRSIYPCVAFALLYAVVLWKLLPSAAPLARDALFGGPLDRGRPADPNRIRPVGEVAGACRVAATVALLVPEVLGSLAADESPAGLARRAALYFVLFLLTRWLNLFRWVVVLTNAVLIVPALVLNPGVRGCAAAVVAKVRQFGKKEKPQ
jgi:hypothetical protein